MIVPVDYFLSQLQIALGANYPQLTLLPDLPDFFIRFKITPATANSSAVPRAASALTPKANILLIFWTNII